MDENKPIVLVSEYDTVFDEKVFEKLPEKFRNETVFRAIRNTLHVLNGETETKINHESEIKARIERIRLEIVGDEIRAMYKMRLRDKVNPYGYEADNPQCKVTSIKYDEEGNLIVKDNLLYLTLKYPNTTYIYDGAIPKVKHIPAEVVKETTVYDKNRMEIAHVKFRTIENRIMPSAWNQAVHNVFNNFEAYLNVAVEKTKIVDETLEKNKYNFDFRNTYFDLLKKIPNHIDPCFLEVITRDTKNDKITAVMDFVSGNKNENAYIWDIVAHKEGDEIKKGIRIDESESDKNRQYVESWRKISSAYYAGLEREKELNFKDDLYLEKNSGSIGRSR